MLSRTFQRFFLEEPTSASLRATAPEAFSTARAIGGSNLRAAEDKLHDGAHEAAVPHLEATLSAMHDLIDGIEERILE